MSISPPAARRHRSGGAMRRKPAGVLPAAILVALAGTANTNALTLSTPSAAYLQAGAGDHVASAALGLRWDLDWYRENGWGRWEGNLDLSVGRWHPSRLSFASGRHDVTQLGITPVIRLRPAGWRQLFLEAGIGANLLSPLYRNGSRQFSTRFNFGDHIALGWRFGASGEHELALRVQHFSNGGAKHPNPGENFIQLRYTRQL